MNNNTSNETKMAVLTATGIAKSYKKKQVIKELSLSASSGSVVGLLGSNGAGKTTLFYMISGLLSPDRGKVILDGHDVTSLPIHRRARLGIGYLPQESSIFGKLSVTDNILSVLEIHYSNLTDRHQHLNSLLTEFGLHHVAHSLGYQLSGGERRRVEIARALAADPKFILLDEPFAGVDPISIHETKAVITQLAKKNIGVIITDHNVRDTLSICDKVYIIHQGTILAEGTPTEVITNTAVKHAYLGDDYE